MTGRTEVCVTYRDKLYYCFLVLLFCKNTLFLKKAKVRIDIQNIYSISVVKVMSE